MGGIVVHDDMDLEPFGDASVDRLEEVQELGRPVSLVALADDEARRDVERGEQRGRAVPYIIVRPGLGYARHHRQNRLLPIERLDLAFLVKAKDKRPVGWREVEADDVAYLSTNNGSVDSLKVWLRCGCRPNAPHIRRIVVCEKPV